MKRTTIILCACAATLLLTQCAEKNSVSHTKTSTKATAKENATSAKTPEEEVAEAKKSVQPEQITNAQSIFTNNCGICHELKQPILFTVKEWDKILPDMSHKAKLSEGDARLLRAWVITNAKMG